MTHPIQPGSKRLQEEYEPLKRQKEICDDASKRSASFLSLPLDILELVAEHLEGSDLKNLSEISLDCQRAALRKKNIQQMQASIEQLKDLAQIHPSKPQQVSSDLDVFKVFLLDIHNGNGHYFFERIVLNSNLLPQLQQQLVILSTHKVSKEFLKLKRASYPLIVDNKICFDQLEKEYSMKKAELVAEAFEHVIFSTRNPEQARSKAIYFAAELGRPEILKALLASGSISDHLRDECLGAAAARGSFEAVKVLIENGPISESFRGSAVYDAVKKADLKEVEFILLSGSIANDCRGRSLRLAAKLGHLDIVKVLLEHGTISDTHRSDAIRWSQKGGHPHVAEYLKKNDS